MGKWLILGILTIINCVSIAQNQSKEQEALITRFESTYGTAKEKMWNSIDGAKPYTDTCYYLASKINSRYYLGKCHTLLARKFSLLTELDSAIIYEEKAIEIFKNYPDSLNLFSEYYNLGNIYLMKNDFVRGLSYYEQVIDIIDANFQTFISIYPQRVFLAQAYCYSSLGLAKSNVADHQGAIDYYFDSQRIIDKLNSADSERLRAINIGNMANAFLAMGDIETAEIYAYKGITLKQELEMNQSTSYSYSTLSEIEYERKNYETSLKHLEIARESFLNSNKINFVYTSDLIKAKCFIGLKKYDEAEELLSELQSNELTASNLDLNFNLLKVYADLYLTKKDHVNASKYLQLSLDTQDSILIKRGQHSITDFISFYERKQSDFNDKYETLRYKEERKKLKFLMQTEEQKKKWIYIFLGVLFLFLIIVIIIIFRANQKNKQVNRELTETITQKQILFQEVHHRVKNNFQITSSLLNLQERMEEDLRSKKVLSDLKGRIKSMSLVHELLYKNNNVEAIEFTAYVEELIESIKNAYGLSKDKVEIKIESDTVYFNLEKAIPIGLILHEGLTNSLKYAFNSSNTGIVLIQMKETKPGTYELLIKDNGVGIPEEVLANTSEKMGLDLVKILSDQIDAEVFVGNNNGAEIRIQFNG